LLAAKNIPNFKIAEEWDIDVSKVGRWRSRFAQTRFTGTEKDMPRESNHWWQ
jgi:hypothetical protein